ncbi:MAG: hypothetical protein ACR2N3_02595 [Pyrinomonadaceae bacterium]
MNENIKIAVVGMGDAFSRYYKEVLFKIHSDNPDCEIYCADKTLRKGDIFDQENFEKQKKLQNKIENILQKDNVFFVDVANLNDRRVNLSEPFSDWIIEKDFDLIIIGTPPEYHIQNVLEWIKSTFSIMLVEKPFTDDSEKIDSLLNYPNEEKVEKVMGFSHVRAKIHRNFEHPDFLKRIEKVIGEITKFRFFYLEDYSGTDKEYVEKSLSEGKQINPDRNCPVLIPGRIDALKEGIVFDLGIHMLSVLDYFMLLGSLKLKRIWAGKYGGVDYVKDKELDIEYETFAAIKFTFLNKKGNPVSGETFLGKGILGIDKNNDFGLDLNNSELGEVKIFELEGDKGKKIQFFFTRRRHSDKNEMLRVIIDGELLKPEAHKIKFELEEKPYSYIFEKALEKRESDKEEIELFFSANTAQSHLNILKEIRDKIEEGRAKRGGKYPKYYLGDREGAKYSGEIIERCKPLHKIMEKFKPIWKDSEK